jgi:hypothetical protein
MITKKMVGIALIVVGVLVVGANFAVDLIGFGKWSGFGPSQWAMLGAGLVAVIAGAAMIPLGDRPA